MDRFEPLIIPQKLKNGDFAKHPLIADFINSRYCEVLIKAFEALDREALYISEFHGSDHIERVMLNGALIAYLMGLSSRDTEIILKACSYHDIGRVDDHGDKIHGPRAAELLSGKMSYLIDKFDETERKYILTAISVHSQDDSTVNDYLKKYSLSGQDAKRAMLITSCLKDSDNLDRYRVGDFNPEFLRTEAGRKMPDVSL